MDETKGPAGVDGDSIVVPPHKRIAIQISDLGVQEEKNGEWIFVSMKVRILFRGQAWDFHETYPIPARMIITPHTGS